MLRHYCRLSDKLSLLFKPRHSRWIRSHYHDETTPQGCDILFVFHFTWNSWSWNRVCRSNMVTKNIYRYNTWKVENNTQKIYKTIVVRYIYNRHQRNSNRIIWIRCKDWWCVVLYEIDFLLKFVIDSWFLACFTRGVKFLNTDMRKFKSSQKDESRTQSADCSLA